MSASTTEPSGEPYDHTLTMAPERPWRPHQDGFDFITIACVARHGVDGARTEVYPAPEAPAVYSHELAPGEVVFCNDRAVYHYTTPVHPAGPEPGHRDVFVVTARIGVDA